MLWLGQDGLGKLKGVEIMSYAGLFGADETCRHDTYWRSCSVCSEIGPKATDAQIKRNRERRDKEQVKRARREASWQTAYENLDPEGRAIAKALWRNLQKTFPGLSKLQLRHAVKGNVYPRNSWAIGKARTVCSQARIAVGALRSFRAKST